ncbi:MAG: uncharacterized protein KVP18_000544 [Porospora cf. gigantea A]|uniref:uncharacterized protein n=1 Tax=Porospora cf. gigantea A TaxID=2853593 RepID=UPI00355A3239|nr:MAG: hypothetical protein KVP18_000544 [Porospora cf. gigantea A]
MGAPPQVLYHKLSPTLELDLQYLMESCGSDIVPVFGNQLLHILLELCRIVDGREVFSPSSIAKIRRICTGPHPFCGRVSMLFAHSNLRGALGAFGDPLLENRFTLGTMRSFLTQPRPASEFHPLYDRSRRSLLWKIRDAGDRVESSVTLWSWIVVDTELFLATRRGAAAMAEVASHVLELIAMVASAKGEAGLAAVCLCLMDSMMRGIPSRCRHSLLGWQSVESVMCMLDMKDRVRLDPEVMATLNAGMDFGRRIRFEPNIGPVLPPNTDHLPDPGTFIAQNGLLFLLTENRWIHGSQHYQPCGFRAVAEYDIDELVRLSTKSFETSTRLVNLSLKLVTELAAEEGIQLSEEEKARLLEDIANSDRRGVMSRAWENSPIKGSVPSMIKDFTKKPRSFRKDPWITYLNKQLSTKTSLGSLAHIALVGYTTLDLLRERAFGDHVDYESVLAAFEPALMAKVRERPQCSLARTFPGLYKQFVEQIANPSTRPIRQNLPTNVIVSVFPSLAARLKLPTALSQLTPPPPAKPLPPDVNAKPAGVSLKPAGVSLKPAGVSLKPAGVSLKPAGVSARPGASPKSQDSPRGHRYNTSVAPLPHISPVTGCGATSLMRPGRTAISDTAAVESAHEISIGALAIRTTLWCNL